MEKKKIYIDSDSFFWPSDISDEYMREQRKFIGFDKEYQTLETLFEQYYLGFRSSMIVCEDGVDNFEETLKIIEDYNQGCLLSAKSYVDKHLSSDSPLPVDYLWITKMEIYNQIKNKYPEAEKIPINLTMRPTISAHIKNKNTIIFPALLRTMLLQCNLVIINHALSVFNSKCKNIDRQYLCRFILPYLLFCHDNISVKNLPIIGGYNSDAIQIALSYTGLQTIFILAHEYAHILLKHFDATRLNENLKENVENEADAFALNVVMKIIEKDITIKKEDVFTAIRWLFKYQILEESVGILTRNDDLSGFFSEYEKRRSSFQSSLIQKYLVRSTTTLDMIGFASIVEIQNTLLKYGSDLINNIIESFKKSNSKVGINPWWEMIV